MKNANRTLRTAVTLLISATLSACTGVAMQGLNAPSYLLGNMRTERGLAYGAQAHQKLDLFFPGEGAAFHGQLVVFVYGGAWTSGSRGSYYFVADALTAAGYAVAIPDYIKYPQGAFPEFVTDVAQAVQWLAGNIDDYADINDFVLMGHSAGAHTAALILTDDAYLRTAGLEKPPISAFVGLAGPYGFKPEKEKYRNIFANLEDFNQMRPLHFANGDEPPMLLLHGEDDTTVLPVNTRKFAARINEGGGSAETKFYPGAGHVAPLLAFARLPLGDSRIQADILEFLQRRSSPPSAQP